MKQLLEGAPVTGETQLHLDRCLTCRACETTCPSGVRYGKLLDIGRSLTEQQVERQPVPAFKRYVLRKILPHRRRFAAAYAVARLVRGILPREIRAKVPQKDPSQSAQAWPPVRHDRRVVLLEGCVQPTLTPAVNIAAANVLDRIGISVIRVAAAGCCGAVAHHLSAQGDTQQQLKHNIDSLWSHVESGVEAIVMTASACTAMLTDYGHLLREDAVYATRAARVSQLAREMSEVVLADVTALRAALRRDASAKPGPKVAFQSPCTLQHAL